MKNNESLKPSIIESIRESVKKGIQHMNGIDRNIFESDWWRTERTISAECLHQIRKEFGDKANITTFAEFKRSFSKEAQLDENAEKEFKELSPEEGEQLCMENHKNKKSDYSMKT